MNTINKLISDKTNNFSIKIVENVFVTWKYFIADRKRHMLRVSELMNKNAIQIGFDAVRDVEWNQRVTE